MWLHFEYSVPYRPNLPFLISDIWALWHLGLSARVPECQQVASYGRETAQAQRFQESAGKRRDWQSLS